MSGVLREIHRRIVRLHRRNAGFTFLAAVDHVIGTFSGDHLPGPDCDGRRMVVDLSMIEPNVADEELLARMAARYAGRDPDEHLQIMVGGVVVFDDLIWRYPDFLARAKAAYAALTDPTLRPGV